MHKQTWWLCLLLKGPPRDKTRFKNNMHETSWNQRITELHLNTTHIKAFLPRLNKNRTSRKRPRLAFFLTCQHSRCRQLSMCESFLCISCLYVQQYFIQQRDHIRSCKAQQLKMLLPGHSKLPTDQACASKSAQGAFCGWIGGGQEARSRPEGVDLRCPYIYVGTYPPCFNLRCLLTLLGLTLDIEFGQRTTSHKGAYNCSCQGCCRCHGFEGLSTYLLQHFSITALSGEKHHCCGWLHICTHLVVSVNSLV